MRITAHFAPISMVALIAGVALSVGSTRPPARAHAAAVLAGGSAPLVIGAPNDPIGGLAPFGHSTVTFSLEPAQPTVGQATTVRVAIVPGGPIMLVREFPVTATDVDTGQTRTTTIVATASYGGPAMYTGSLIFPTAGSWDVTAPGWRSAVGDHLTVTVVAEPSPPSHAQSLPPIVPPPPCHFQLGFAALHSLIPSIVGDCNGDETPTVTGDTLQQTIGGLLVWRKRDNVAAFTDGYRTWVNGPAGLQMRLNGERFTWESAAGTACGQCHHLAPAEVVSALLTAVVADPTGGSAIRYLTTPLRVRAQTTPGVLITLLGLHGNLAGYTITNDPGVANDPAMVTATLDLPSGNTVARSFTVVRDAGHWRIASITPAALAIAS